MRRAKTGPYEEKLMVILDASPQGYFALLRSTLR
jgi:hypothetical protein